MRRGAGGDTKGRIALRFASVGSSASLGISAAGSHPPIASTCALGLNHDVIGSSGYRYSWLYQQFD